MTRRCHPSNVRSVIFYLQLGQIRTGGFPGGLRQPGAVWWVGSILDGVTGCGQYVGTYLCRGRMLWR